MDTEFYVMLRPDDMGLERVELPQPTCMKDMGLGGWDQTCRGLQEVS